MKLPSDLLRIITLGVVIMSKGLFASEPLTLDSVAESMGDTLYVVFDFQEEPPLEVINALRSYWVNQKGIQEVVFIFSDDPSFDAAKKQLKGKNFYLYGTFAPKEENLFIGIRELQRTYWALIPLTDGSEVFITVQDDKGQIATQSVEMLSLQDYDS